MNGIEKITGRILEDAQAEVNEILSKAEAEAASIKAKYERQAKLESDILLRHGKERADERERNLAGTAALEARKATLAAKQKVVDKAFALAEKKLLDLPQKDYAALLASLAASSSHSGTEEIILSQKDRDELGAEVLKEANALLSNAGKVAKLSLSKETRPTGGGLLLKDGKIETNCTFDTLLRLVRSDISGDVAAVLFASS